MYDKDQIHSMWDKVYRALFIETSFENKAFNTNMKKYIEE